MRNKGKVPEKQKTIILFLLFFLLWPTLGFSAENGKRFVDHGDGTITDQETGLMWVKDPNHIGTYCKKNKEDIPCKALINPETSFMYFEKAQMVVSLLTFAGYDDWRLPTKTEAEILLQIQQNKIENPFGGMMPMYWTSTQEERWDKHGVALIGEGIMLPMMNNTLVFVWPIRDSKK